jgi:hypothetical protein
MNRRLGLLLVSFLAAGSLQVGVAPVASASSACADPNCPWSPVTMLVKRYIEAVDRFCDENTTFGCPL